MYRLFCPLLLLASFYADAQSSPVPRFSGTGTLTPTPPSSSNGRFALRAEMRAPQVADTNSRFKVTASIRPGGDADALATACSAASAAIFANGFEL